MAVYSTGVTATFPGALFTEISSLSFNFGGGHLEGRSSKFKAVRGQVQFELLNGATTAIHGDRGTPGITGGGIALTVAAVCVDVGVVAEVNGLTRYSYTFDIVE